MKRWAGKLERIVGERRVMFLAVNEILFSLNLALAIVYGTIRYSAGVASASKDSRYPFGVLYYFLRAAVRVDNILRLNPAQPAPREPAVGTSLGIDLAYVVTLLGVGAAVLLLLRLLGCRGKATSGASGPMRGSDGRLEPRCSGSLRGPRGEEQVRPEGLRRGSGDTPFGEIPQSQGGPTPWDCGMTGARQPRGDAEVKGLRRRKRESQAGSETPPVPPFVTPVAF